MGKSGKEWENMGLEWCALLVICVAVLCVIYVTVL